MLIIDTERLILQPFSPEDAGEYYSLVDDPDIRKFVPYAGYDSFEQTQELVKAYSKGDFKNDFYFEIYNQNYGKIIGALIAIRIAPCRLDVSCLIGKNFRNHGFVTEALLGFENFLITDCNYMFSHLVFTIDSQNHSSQAVMKQIGARKVRNKNGTIIYTKKLNHLDLL